MSAIWYQHLSDFGLRPFVATSRHVLPALDLSHLGPDPLIRLLEQPEDIPFHAAYQTANALAFGARDLKMPGWVYIDCVLMQSAVIGFAAPADMVPAALRQEFEADGATLPAWLPIAGQTASASLDAKVLVGFSLFSLRKLWPELPAMGLLTKALALEAYRAQNFDRFLGVSQYDNPALAMHGHFGKGVEIVSAQLPLHAQGDRSLIYGMKIDFDPAQLGSLPPAWAEPDMVISADDQVAISRLAAGIGLGRRYFLLPPFQIREGSSFKLPVTEVPPT